MIMVDLTKLVVCFSAVITTWVFFQLASSHQHQVQIPQALQSLASPLNTSEALALLGNQLPTTTGSWPSSSVGKALCESAELLCDPNKWISYRQGKVAVCVSMFSYLYGDGNCSRREGDQQGGPKKRGIGQGTDKKNNDHNDENQGEGDDEQDDDDDDDDDEGEDEDDYDENDDDYYEDYREDYGGHERESVDYHAVATHRVGNYAKSQHVFFKLADLIKQKFVTVPDLSNDLMNRSFLPSGLASFFPLIKSNLIDFLHFFNISVDSQMGRSMQITLELCSSPQERVTCVSSIQSMVEFAVEYVGSSAEAHSSPPNAKRLQPNATIFNITLISHHFAPCHDSMFPYLVYVCHVPTSSKVLDVTLQSQGQIFHSLVACHTNTSSWDPHHVAFQTLDAKPGEGEICHWFPENAFIWIPK